MGSASCYYHIIANSPMPCGGGGGGDDDDDDAGVVVNPDQGSKSRPNSSVDHAINYVNSQPRVKHPREIKKSIDCHIKKPMDKFLEKKKDIRVVGNERRFEIFHGEKANDNLTGGEEKKKKKKKKNNTRTTFVRE